ncbi:UNVERIFIED_CONTAM: High mobility group B protein 10 [Sesamum latifolium]|uniref:High mobility group B protein 10 n=1 Tax=Sesamum latifolium TaxID=2727402 RepID=A0AAW2WR35_9LAMI
MSESNVPVPPAEKRTTKYSTYPKPEAEYQEIIQNPEIFLQKLQAFHVFYGTKFRIPTIGGSRLDLHQLFLEVTSRGGIEKVIRDRRWKEVTAAFKFPTSITSASFVLRKYYLSLLYHFEQCIISGKKNHPFQKLTHAINGGAAADQLPASPNLEDGSLITGTIDGKFDYGYLVTVNLGSEELKGVLYHTSSELDVSQSFSASGDPTQRIRRKHQIALRDPAHPKRNRSGYTFFFAEQYQRLRPLYHGQERAISKKIGQLWSRLTEAEKQVYQEKGLRDKERYKAEMLEYKSSQHPQP